MQNIEIQPGTEVAIKRPKQGRYRFYGYEYTFTKIVRVTKARIFVQFGRGELEFNRADLTQRGASYNPSTLVVDPVEHAKIREELVAEEARSTLEGNALNALEFIKERFDRSLGHYMVRNRTEAEIQLLIELAERLRFLKAKQD